MFKVFFARTETKVMDDLALDDGGENFSIKTCRCRFTGNEVGILSLEFNTKLLPPKRNVD